MPSAEDIKQIGIIIVTHVDYGSSLLKAAEFILGPVQDCTSIQVDASFEVEETVNRLKEAVNLLDKGQGVLVLTDMFGGTPHEPEPLSFGSPAGCGSAHRSQPAHAAPCSGQQEAAIIRVGGACPGGRVRRYYCRRQSTSLKDRVAQGRAGMIWFRIDNRLVHGQVIEAWLPYLRAGTLVVLNDDLAADTLQQQIMKLAIPARIEIQFIRVDVALEVYEVLLKKNVSSLFLVSNCMDIARVQEQGIDIPVVNVGNIHYAPGKQQICAHVAVSPDEKACLKFLESSGITLDFRAVPSDVPSIGVWNAC